jgi:hypothetical protein
MKSTLGEEFPSGRCSITFDIATVPKVTISRDLSGAMQVDDEAKVRQTNTERGTLSITVADVMADSAIDELHLGMASNPKCPPHILDRFVSLEIGDVTKAVAANPATTLPTLITLFELSFAIIDTQPKDEPVAEGPMAGLYVGPDTAVRHAHRVLAAVASNAMLPLTYVERLWLSQDSDLQVMAGYSPKLPAEIRDVFAASENFRLRRVVASHEFVEIDMLRQLAQDEDEGVRRAVAGNPRTPASVLHRMVKDESRIVHQALRKNPSLTPALRQKMNAALPLPPSAVSPIRPAIVDSLPSTGQEFSEFVSAKNFSSTMWLYLAGSPTTPFDFVIGSLDNVLDLPSYSHGVSPQLYAARQDRTPESQLELLASSKEQRVRKEVAKRLAGGLTSAAVLEVLVRDESSGVRKAVASHAGPAFPEVLWNELANDAKPAVRAAVLENPNAPDVIRAVARMNELSEAYVD